MDLTRYKHLDKWNR